MFTMSRFSELMAMPLPSKRDIAPVTETADTEAVKLDKEAEDAKKEIEKDKPEKDEKCSESKLSMESDDDEVGSSDIEDLSGLDDFDPDELSDEELENLDRELGDEALGDISGADDEDEVTLTPDEEVEADDMMSIASTTMLVNDELNADEKAKFAANESEIRTVINEGFMTEADANMLAQEAGLIQENSYNKKMIIRLDAEAKKKQLYALGINVSAAAHNDPDYRKLKKIMHARKLVRARLDKKYHNEALKRMRIYFNRLRKSRSTVLQKIASSVNAK